MLVKCCEKRKIVYSLTKFKGGAMIFWFYFYIFAVD